MCGCVTFDVLNFLCNFVGVFTLVHVRFGVSLLVCHDVSIMPSVVCVLVCECEGELSLFLRIVKYGCGAVYNFYAAPLVANC